MLYGPKTLVKTILEGIAPSWLNMSPWRAIWTLFVPNLMDLFCFSPHFLRKISIPCLGCSPRGVQNFEKFVFSEKTSIPCLGCSPRGVQNFKRCTFYAKKLVFHAYNPYITIFAILGTLKNSYTTICYITEFWPNLGPKFPPGGDWLSKMFICL